MAKQNIFQPPRCASSVLSNMEFITCQKKKPPPTISAGRQELLPVLRERRALFREEQLALSCGQVS